MSVFLALVRRELGVAFNSMTGYVVVAVTLLLTGFSLVDISHDGQRLAAAWTRHGENTWFFKFSGSAPVVAAEIAKFTALLESIRFHTPD